MHRIAIAVLALLAAIDCLYAGSGSGSGAPTPDPFYLNEAGGQAQTQYPLRATTAKTLAPSQAINTSIRNLVLITAGQSNLGNIAPTPYTPANPTKLFNPNVYDGATYFASDPLLGCSYTVISSVTDVGNPILRLADALVSAGKFDAVYIVPVAINGTSIADWTTGGVHSDRVPVAIRRLAQRGIVPGPNVTFAILWGQGEANTSTGTSQATYQTALNTIIANAAAAGFSGRWFVAVQSWNSVRTSGPIQAAQLAVVNNTTVFRGANADALIGNSCNGGGACRQDGLHWSDNGSIAYALDAANGWLPAMQASGAPF